MALIPRQVFPWERITAPKQQRPAQDDEEVEEIHVWPNYSQALVPRAGGRYMDMILPPSGMSVWDMPTSKLQTTALATTFVAAALLVTALSGAGMLAVLFTGFVMSASVLILVTVCTGVVALIVTGVPLGYVAWQLLSRYQQYKFGDMGGGHGWMGGHDGD